MRAKDGKRFPNVADAVKCWYDWKQGGREVRRGKNRVKGQKGFGPVEEASALARHLSFSGQESLAEPACNRPEVSGLS